MLWLLKLTAVFVKIANRSNSLNYYSKSKRHEEVHTIFMDFEKTCDVKLE